MSTTNTTTPRAYVVSLAAYTAGHHHGVWVDIDDDEDTIQGHIDTLLATCPVARSTGCPSEEYAVHDRERCPDMGEYPSVATLAIVGALCEAHGAYVVGEAMGDTGDDPDLVEEYLSEHYHGTTGTYKAEWGLEQCSYADWAQGYAEEMGILPEEHSVTSYVNWEKWADEQGFRCVLHDHLYHIWN